MAKEPKKSELMKTPVKAPAATNVAVPEFLKQHLLDTRGNEEVTNADLSIPRIELIQGLSKARKKSDPSYIEGAEEGMLYNNVTRQLYGTSILVVPVMFRKEYLLWRDVDLGGGFGGSFPTLAEAEAARITKDSPTEWESVDTNQHFVIVVHKDDPPEEAVISMARTKAKTSRLWNSLIRLNGGPRFSRIYELSGVPAQNRSGQDYYTLQVRTVGFVTEDLYRAGERVYNLVSSGAVSVNTEFDGIDADLVLDEEM
jgi:hypothetical protein